MHHSIVSVSNHFSRNNQCIPILSFYIRVGMEIEYWTSLNPNPGQCSHLSSISKLASSFYFIVICTYLCDLFRFFKWCMLIRSSIASLCQCPLLYILVAGIIIVNVPISNEFKCFKLYSYITTQRTFTNKEVQVYIVTSAYRQVHLVTDIKYGRRTCKFSFIIER